MPRPDPAWKGAGRDGATARRRDAGGTTTVPRRRRGACPAPRPVL